MPSAFYNCTSLTSVTIPDSITAIIDSAFRNCTSLKNITFPDSITTIGASSFMGCTSLKTITIPENATKVGGQAFQGCTALTRINWNAKNVNNFGATNYTFSKAGQKSTGIDVIFGENVETIPSYLLYPGNEEYAPNIASITMGNNIKTIGESAFRGLSNIVSITIPENVTSIGKHAFQDCLSVETIYRKCI